jgi:predicted  nucleic acid-binding Zn ribbon protein
MRHEIFGGGDQICVVGRTSLGQQNVQSVDDARQQGETREQDVDQQITTAAALPQHGQWLQRRIVYSFNGPVHGLWFVTSPSVAQSVQRTHPMSYSVHSLS